MQISSSSFRATPYWLNFVFTGQFFTVHHRYTIAAGGTAYLQAKTNSRLFHTVARSMNFDGTGPVVVDAIESPTITDGTTPPDVVSNLDRRSSKTPTTQIFVDPTGVSGGTLIDRDVLFSTGGGFFGGNATGTFVSANWERVLKQSDSTILAINNTGGDTVDFIVSIVFYESGN